MAAEEESGEGEKNLVFGVIGFVVVLLLLFGWLNTIPFFNNATDGGFSANRILGAGDVAVGRAVVNRELASVRQQVGGAILGTQAKRESGVITAGPIDAFGSTWWRVNYPDAPDGWVEERSITSKIFLFRLLNIFPILYENIVRPLGIGLTVIGMIIFIVLKLLMNGAVEHEAKMQAVRRERALAFYKPELLQAEQAVDEPGSVPGNLPTGDEASGLSFEQHTGAKNERWEHVLKLLETHNENDWKQAVLEADIILESMVERMGYEGETLGERMKQIEPSDFVTLESAWEAHRVRNKIAHAGTEFRLTKDEATRVIGLYRNVFQEFYYI